MGFDILLSVYHYTYNRSKLLPTINTAYENFTSSLWKFYDL